jgi:hypothetical protein
MDPKNDFVFTQLKQIATQGGEKGPLFDQGVLFVIRQIEETGSFQPHPITSIDDPPQVLTDGERREMQSLIAVKGWSHEQAQQFSKGVWQAEMTLQAYRKKPSAK